MPYGPKDLLYGLALPALIAAVVCFVVRRVPIGDVGRRYSASVGLVLGFLLGYRLLAVGPWMPESHWHWLPHLLLISMILGPVGSAAGISWIERPLLYACTAVIAAWFLVPTWPSLDPSRTTHIIAWAILVVACASLLEPLTRKIISWVLPAILSATLASGAVVLALSESLRFASVLIAGFAAMSGVAVASRFCRRDTSIEGIALPFAVLVCGMMLVGKVNSFSDVPLASYLLVPVAPLLLWITIRGPLSRFTGWKLAALQLAVPLCVGGLAIGLAVMADSQS